MLPQGGLPAGAVTEVLAAEDGVGSMSLALRVAQRAAGSDGRVIFVDTWGDFYPPAAFAMGLVSQQLVVVRSRRAAEALWACDQALRCRGVSAVIARLRYLDGRTSRRMQLAAESSGAVGLILRPAANGARTFAAVQLRVDPGGAAGGGRACRISILHVREGMPVDPFVIELGHETGTLPLHAVPVDRAGASAVRLVGA